MQAMCFVYAAISYICMGDAESSAKALDLIGPVLGVMDSFTGVREKTSVLLAHGFLLMRQQNLQEARAVMGEDTIFFAVGFKSYNRLGWFLEQIHDAISKTQNDILAKSTVGSLSEEIPDITLSEIRRRKSSVRSGTSVDVWIRTEEETELRNHLKWARLKSWVEVSARVASDERTLVVPINQRSKDLIGYRGDESLLGFTELNDPIAKLEAISIPPSVLRCIKTKGTDLEENSMEKEDDMEDNVDRETVEVSDKYPVLPDSHRPLDNYWTQELNSQRGEKNNSLTIIEDAVPLNQRSLEEEDDPDFDMPIWIYQNITKLSNDFGVDIKGMGCKEEATRLFIKIVSWNVRGPNQANKRCVIKNLIQGWKADVYCFQETKIEEDVRNIVKDYWANRGVGFCQLEASGTRGGILIPWDEKFWTGDVSNVGAYSISCKFIK
ncbi:hypothetical protein MTR67_039962 [Solanum verrucosum]|uniref:Endonuclease/exonuclease/phosphatase domain-containing protein n=1 Tax=Solanum verrucosum TaxID=315347 RepID=A0AAF0ZP22_SOLVR|nr:hypothetical protein MTR67_039962 [Solanum verrucosum]